MGRPIRGAVESCRNLAQVSYLRACLGMSQEQLCRFIQRLAPGDGGLTEPQARSFVTGKQAASVARAQRLERFAPGVLEVTKWPWFALDFDRCSPRNLRLAQGSQSRSWTQESSLERLSSITTRRCWSWARSFFGFFVSFRVAEVHLDQRQMCRCCNGLYRSLEGALEHPAIEPLVHELHHAIGEATGRHVLVVYGSVGNRIRFDRLYGSQRHIFNPKRTD